MKKIIVLALGIGVLAFLTWYAMDLANNKGKSDTELIEFSVKDVTTVDKVIITDAFGNTFEIVKQGDRWTDKDGGCINQQSAEFILEAFQKIEFKGYLPDASHARYKTLMAAQHTKVEIFQNGAWTKTWYIGPAAQDHYGQIMLLDSDEYGKSDIPVLMKIKGLNGIIEPRFFADPRKWMCTEIFSIPANDIAKVDVQFFEEKRRSFTVTKQGADMKVYQQGKLLSGVDTAMIFRYLHNYQKVHYEKANYEYDQRQVDSLIATPPFAILTVEETNGTVSKLKCFRIKYKDVDTNGVIQYRDNNKERFWCLLPSGQLVKCQYFVFNPLFLGHIYFPMDVSMLNTPDGIPDK